MRLILFRSLLKERGNQNISKQLLAGVAASSTPTQHEVVSDGVELSLVQLCALDPCILRDFAACSQTERLICCMYATCVDDVRHQLDQLSNQLSSVSSLPLELVTMTHIMNTTTAKKQLSPPPPLPVQDTIEYLYDVLPLCAEFLEAFPVVGSSSGRRNAHGYPMDQHVLGVCHEFPSLSMMQEQQQQCVAQVVDVLPPTRLTLHTGSHSFLLVSDMNNYTNYNQLVYDKGGDLETIGEHTDHVTVVADDGNPRQGRIAGNFLRSLWTWQRDEGGLETYVTVTAGNVESEQMVVRQMQELFHSWSLDNSVRKEEEED